MDYEGARLSVARIGNITRRGKTAILESTGQPFSPAKLAA